MTQSVLNARPSPEQPETNINSRTRIANGLTGVLADSFVLMIKTQGYHWNVVGPLFFPIHTLTEQHYTDLFTAIDVIAERIRALGHVAPMAFTDMISQASLSEESTARSAGEMIARLVSDHEAMVRRLRDLAQTAADLGDGATEDLANGRMAFHEQAIWMLSAIVAE